MVTRDKNGSLYTTNFTLKSFLCFDRLHIGREIEKILRLRTREMTGIREDVCFVCSYMYFFWHVLFLRWWNGWGVVLAHRSKISKLEKYTSSTTVGPVIQCWGGKFLMRVDIRKIQLKVFGEVGFVSRSYRSRNNTGVVDRSVRLFVERFCGLLFFFKNFHIFFFLNPFIHKSQPKHCATRARLAFQKLIAVRRKSLTTRSQKTHSHSRDLVKEQWTNEWEERDSDRGERNGHLQKW